METITAWDGPCMELADRYRSARHAGARVKVEFIRVINRRLGSIIILLAKQDWPLLVGCRILGHFMITPTIFPS